MIDRGLRRWGDLQQRYDDDEQPTRMALFALGAVVEEVIYVAEQRAMMVYAHLTGQLAEYKRGRPMAMNDRKLLVGMNSSWTEGMGTGLSLLDGVPPDQSIGKEQLFAATAANDAYSEENGGLEPTMKWLGLPVKEATDLALQRAAAIIKEAPRSDFQKKRGTPVTVTAYSGLWLDGLSGAWRAGGAVLAAQDPPSP